MATVCLFMQRSPGWLKCAPVVHAVRWSARSDVPWRSGAGSVPASVSLDRFTIQIQRLASDVSSFELGAPHAGADSLDDQVAFELGDGSDDDHDGTAQRPAGVDVLAEADELDAEMVQFIEHIEIVLYRPGDPVRGPDQHDVELTAASFAHQLIESWPLGLGAADAIRVLGDDLIAALGSHLAKVVAAASRDADRQSRLSYRGRRASWQLPRVQPEDAFDEQELAVDHGQPLPDDRLSVEGNAPGTLQVGEVEFKLL